METHNSGQLEPEGKNGSPEFESDAPPKVRRDPPVPKVNRVLLVALSCISLFFAAGACYNQNALGHLLRSTSIFPCPETFGLDAEPEEVARCREIELSIAMAFKAHQTADLLGGVGTSVLYDLLGPRTVYCMGTILAAAGSFIAFINLKTFFVGVVLLGLAINCLLTPVLSIANLFGLGNKVVMTVLSASVTFSMIQFPVFDVLTTIWAFPASTGFITIGVVSAASFFFGLFCLPDRPFDDVSRAVYKKKYSSESSDESQGNSKGSSSIVGGGVNDETRPLLKAFKRVAKGKSRSGLLIALRSLLPPEEKFKLYGHLTLWKCITTPAYLLFLLVFTFICCANLLYLDANESILRSAGDDGTIANVFAWLMPAQAALCVFIGILMEWQGISFVTFSIVSSITVAWGIALSPHKEVQWIAVFAFHYAFSTFISLVYAFVGEHFPTKYFGTLYAVPALCGAVVNLLVGPAVITTVRTKLKDDWTLPAYVLVAWGIVTIFVSLMVTLLLRRATRRRIRHLAAQTEPRLHPIREICSSGSISESSDTYRGKAHTKLGLGDRPLPAEEDDFNMFAGEGHNRGESESEPSKVNATVRSKKKKGGKKSKKPNR